MSNEDAQIIDRARKVTGASRYAFAKAATLAEARRLAIEIGKREPAPS